MARSDSVLSIKTFFGINDKAFIVFGPGDLSFAAGSSEGGGVKGKLKVVGGGEIGSFRTVLVGKIGIGIKVFHILSLSVQNIVSKITNLELKQRVFMS